MADAQMQKEPRSLKDCIRIRKGKKDTNTIKT